MDQTKLGDTHALIQKRGFAPRRQYHINNISVSDENMFTKIIPQKPSESISKSQHNPFKDADQSTVSTEVGSMIFLHQSVKDSKGVKTPVSILQEFLNRRGITPTYELLQIDGPVHEPIFRYRGSFNNIYETFTALGTGRSKKGAKQAVARALIKNIQNSETGSLNIETDMFLLNMCKDNKTTVGNENATDIVLSNPIGCLQEFCMSNHWPPPIYNTETEVGLSHEYLFTIACSILNFEEIGKGKSKKTAKREAAHKMWLRLNNNPVNSDKINETSPFKINAKNSYYSDLKDFPISTIITQHSSKASQFYNSTGKDILKLQDMCLNNFAYDYVKQLLEVANENQFKATYLNIHNKIMSNVFECLVQLSTVPVAVCHGIGRTSEEAQHEAACNALEYLKTVTKK